MFSGEKGIPEIISRLLHQMGNGGGREDGPSLLLWGWSRDRWSELVGEQARDNARLFFRVASRILRNRESAEDACQSALIKALEKPEQILDRRKIRAWLTRIVVTESLMLVRKRKSDDGQLKITGLDTIPPDRRNDGFVLREAALEALEKLDPESRLVFVLVEMDEMNGVQVAELLDISQSTVTRRLREAHDQLARLLSDWNER